MRTSSESVGFDSALARVREASGRLGSEMAGLLDAGGRVLASDVVAGDPVPGADNSAMDGFAVRSADLAAAVPGAPVELEVVDESRAGSPADRPVGPGEAIAISTGAVMPAGADAVVPIELVDRNGTFDSIACSGPTVPSAHVRFAGEDVTAGSVVLGAGTELGPAELGILAAVGADPVEVSVRPSVRLLTTGEELVDPSDPAPPGSVRDSSSVSIPALVEASGGITAGQMRIGDDPEMTATAVQQSLGGDILCVCGGMSVGEHDHVRDALARAGVVERFFRIELKPGRPTWFGVAPDGALVFGLPGNPVSAFVTFVLFAGEAIRRMLGSRERSRFEARLDPSVSLDGLLGKGRLNAVRVCLVSDGDLLLARPTGRQESHLMGSFRGADALALVAPDAVPGDRVEVVPIPGAGRLR